MMNRERACAIALAVLVLVTSPIAFLAQSKPEHSQAVSVLVTIASKTKDPPPAVSRDDVFVHQDNQTRRVLDWHLIPKDTTPLEVVLYVDQALNSSVAGPLQDAASFVRALPPQARVAVAYSLSGHPQLAQDFTTDRDAVGKALHVPMGRFTGSYGLFSGLADLVRGWQMTPARHVILLVSDGLDAMRGVAQMQPDVNPDMAALIDLLHRKGIVVFTIYANRLPLSAPPDPFLSVGQSCLQYLSDETGGEAFLGLQTAFSFTPYLNQISADLGNQYLLTFDALSVNNNKPKLSKLQVGAEVTGIVIHAPAHVIVPARPAAQ
jgi:hypothetical protein